MVSDPQTPTVRSSSRVRTLVLLLVVIGLFCVWWMQGGRLNFAQLKQKPVPHVPIHVRSEQGWLTSEIGRQIAETAGFAKTGKGPRALRLEAEAILRGRDAYQFETKTSGGNPVSARIQLANYLWDPNNFTGLAKQLIGAGAGATPHPRSAPDRELFQRLIHPSSEVLIREDKRLSDALTKQPLDPELHEEAALLVGSFALRHAAAGFYDVRRELCRMTAHLALARALDENSGPCGDLAEAILCTLVGRQSAALEILQRVDRNRDTTGGLPLEANTIWIRALTMRNTGDYRKLDQPEHASLLERLEYVRALRSSVSSEAASNFLLQFPAERLSEWSNLIFTGPLSISDGHLWLARAPGNELDETAAQYRSYSGQRFTDGEMAAALNAPPDRIKEPTKQPARLEVLGWGMWAGLHQRQLCQILDTTWLWLQDQLGVPEDAKEFKKAMTKRFSELELFPLVRMESEHDRSDVTEADRRLAKLWREKPELVPYEFWNSPASRLKRATGKAPLPHPISWFSPMFPLGTLYDVANRGESGFPRLTQTELDKLKAVAPYNNRVLYFQMRNATPPVKTPDELAAQFESVAGYDAWSMEVLANGVLADPDRYEAVFTRLCQLNPNQYVQLGKYLCEHKRDEAAAKAYQKAVDLAPDRVHVSNSVGWLVDYYYTHNRKTEAFAVAEMAADVYSARGLETMARLCERDGRLPDAETHFEKAAKRYENWAELALFYVRHRSEPKYSAAFERIALKIFPKGEEPADMSAMNGAPNDGVSLDGTNKTTQPLGLQMGDIVVAINGVRIRNKGQYFYKMDSAPSPKIDLVVWSSRVYRAVTVNLPNRRLGVNISNFTPPMPR